jgi:hypothetical protein
MVIIIDMENGERTFVQDEKQESASTLLIEPGWVCPELQPHPASTVDERKIMPALMEYPFVTTR